jgi:hypothetical protein
MWNANWTLKRHVKTEHNRNTLHKLKNVHTCAGKVVIPIVQRHLHGRAWKPTIEPLSCQHGHIRVACVRQSDAQALGGFVKLLDELACRLCFLRRNFSTETRTIDNITIRSLATQHSHETYHKK